MTTPIRIAITPGEPAGIGPDLVIHLAQRTWDAQLVLFADADMLSERARLLNLPLTIIPFEDDLHYVQRASELIVKHIPVGSTVEPGVLNAENGQYVVETLRQACEQNMQGTFDAVVTGPVHKGIINKAGISFSGHTEYFAQQSNTSDVVMMLAL